MITCQIYVRCLCFCLLFLQLGHTAEREHPYLWADKARFAELRQLVKTPVYQMRYQRLINWADAALAKEVQGYALSSFLGEGIATSCAFAYQMTGKKEYAERAKKEVFALLKVSRWCSDKHAPFTKGADLGHGHCSMTCATVYDWCADTFTQAEREIFIKGAERLCLAFYKKSLNEGDYWVDNTVTNWAGTCHGGAGCVALALYDESALAKELAPIAWKHIETFLRGVHLQDGGGHEGVMYHHYGLGYAHVAADAMSQFFGSDNGLYDAINKKAVGYWSVYMYGPDHIYANFNDFHEGFLRGMFDEAGRGKANHYFAELFALYESKVLGGDPFLLWAADNAHGQWTYGNTAPWWLLWRRPAVQSSKQRPPLDDCVLFREAGQSVWQSGKWWLAFNGGWTSNRSHGNKDLGTFVLVYGEQRVIRDPGYGKQETSDHSTLLINGQGQETNVKGTILVHGKDQGIKYVACDLAGTYPALGLKHYVRHLICLKDKYVIVLDDVLCQKASKLEQQFQMASAVSIANERVLVSLNGANLSMTNLSRPTTTWSGGSGSQSRLVQVANQVEMAQLCTVFADCAAPKAEWKGKILIIDGQELEFKDSRVGLILYTYNGERLDFGDMQERSFTVYRKDGALAAKEKPTKSYKTKKEKAEPVDTEEAEPNTSSANAVPDFAVWDVDLIKQVIAAVAAEKPLIFTCTMFKGDSRVTAAAEKTITIKTFNMAMPLPWSRLKLEDKASLAEALAKAQPDDALSHALAGVYLKGSMELIKANKYLSRAAEYAERIRLTFE